MGSFGGGPFLPRIPKTPLAPVLIMTESLVDRVQNFYEHTGGKGHILGPGGKEAMELIEQFTGPYKEIIEKVLSGIGLIDSEAEKLEKKLDEMEQEEKCIHRQLHQP